MPATVVARPRTARHVRSAPVLLRVAAATIPSSQDDQVDSGDCLLAPSFRLCSVWPGDRFSCLLRNNRAGLGCPIVQYSRRELYGIIPRVQEPIGLGLLLSAIPADPRMKVPAAKVTA